jgi:hypothetical protein
MIRIIRALHGNFVMGLGVAVVLYVFAVAVVNAALK